MTEQDEHEGWVDRRWSVPKTVWDQILEMASHSGIHYAELTAMLLEDGIKVRMREPLVAAMPPPPAPDPWTVTYVQDDKGKDLGKLELRQVPSKSEILSLEGKSYVVTQRAWSASDGQTVAFLRVRPWQPSTNSARPKG
jgi:hypothetical protein